MNEWGFVRQNKNIWTRAHHLLIRWGHMSKLICLEGKKKMRQAAKFFLKSFQTLKKKGPDDVCTYKSKNKRTTTATAPKKKYNTRSINKWAGTCQGTCVLCVLMPEEYCAETGARRAQAEGERSWQWLRRWGFDGKVTKSSNKMRLVD